MCNSPMTKQAPLHSDAELIDSLGGPSKLARRLGFKNPGGVQRVQNWKYRGIPEIVRLRHPKVFRKVVASEAANAA